MDRNYGIQWRQDIIKKAAGTGLLEKVAASYKIQRPITKDTTVLRVVTPWKLVNTEITAPSVYHEVGGSRFYLKDGT